MTRETHHHCQCDYCDGEDCKDLPKAVRCELTTEELIQELKTRGEGVSSFKVNRGTLCYDITDDDTTIIVVKK